MKKILLATTLMAATAFAANADASKSFNGAYLGAQAGFVKSKTKSQITNEQLVTLVSTRNLSSNINKSSNGFLYGTYFGYGRNLDGFYIGGEMSILSDTAKRTVNATGTDGANDTYTSNVKYKRGIAFGFAPRMGYVFGDNLVYVKPGFEISRDKATLNMSETTANVTTVDPTVSKSKTAFVFTPAFGYERAMGNIILRAEYTYNPGNKITIKDNNAPITAIGDVSYKDHRFAIGAAYKF